MKDNIALTQQNNDANKEQFSQMVTVFSRQQHEVAMAAITSNKSTSSSSSSSTAAAPASPSAKEQYLEARKKRKNHEEMVAGMSGEGGALSPDTANRVEKIAKRLKADEGAKYKTWLDSTYDET